MLHKCLLCLYLTIFRSGEQHLQKTTHLQTTRYLSSHSVACFTVSQSLIQSNALGNYVTLSWRWTENAFVSQTMYSSNHVVTPQCQCMSTV